MSDLDRLLEATNERLAPLEAELIAGFTAPRWPVVFLVGAPRSGHTLLSQLLARSGALGFIDNLTARFWSAPVLATRIARAARLEPGSGAGAPLRSDQGRTEGWWEPHEAGRFLRRWITFRDSHRASPQATAPEDGATWRRELAALEALHGRPLLFRNLIYGQNIPLVHGAVPGALFVVCRRRVAFQAQSILAARERRAQGRGAWWSLRPEGWEALSSAPPEDQVVGQIVAAHQRIEADIAAVGADWMEVRYEAVCRDPRAEVGRVAARLAQAGAPARVAAGELPAELACADQVRLSPVEWTRLGDAVRRLAPTEPTD